MWDNYPVLTFIAVFRLVCLIIWSGTVFYATYEVHLATTKYSRQAENETESPSSIDFGLDFWNWPRDSTDEEWDLFVHTFLTKMAYWFGSYILISYILSEVKVHVRMVASVLMTFGLCIDMMGWRSLIFIVQQPILYCILLQKWRNRAVLWAFTIFLLLFSKCTWMLYSYIIVGKEDWVIAEYWFQIITAWNCMRCLSFCFDNWYHPRPSLLNLLAYVFYFPTALIGPIVLYSTFERDVLQEHGQRRSLKCLVSKICYIGCIVLLAESILRVVHFRKLSWDTTVLWELNLWAIGGIMACLGQFFLLKYHAIYGIGTSIAEYEGLTMPPLPKCPARIHRYSVIWKDFDRGLFDFLVRYTYVPTIKFLGTFQYTKSWNSELKKFIASIITFAYIYIWHGYYYSVLIWALFNFIGITLERAGTFVKKKIASNLEIDNMIWDFILEPIFTVPLAAMSILNSVVFLGNLTAAKIFTYRVYSTWHQSLVIPILFTFTHVAVGIRTWPEFWPKLKTSWKSNRC